MDMHCHADGGRQKAARNGRSGVAKVGRSRRVIKTSLRLRAKAMFRQELPVPCRPNPCRGPLSKHQPIEIYKKSALATVLPRACASVDFLGYLNKRDSWA